MMLNDIIKDLPEKTLSGTGDVAVTGIAYDSRKVKPGDLFVAVDGFETDGHAYAAAAVENGAAAVMVRRPVDGAENVPVVTVPDTRQGLSLAAQAFYGHPARKLKTAGITGTNGKTSVSYLTAAVMEKAGIPAGILGTIAYRTGNRTVAASHTTPESADLQGYLAEMVDQGLAGAAMEVSSHSLALDRLYGMRFDTAVFTNLSRDHLDFHKDFEAYLEAKMKLFSELSNKHTTAVINADDPAAGRIIKACPGRVLTYGIEKEADIIAEDVRLSDSGTVMQLKSPAGSCRLETGLLGQFNVINTLAAAGAGLGLDISLDAITAALAEVPGVRGRFEAVRVPGKPMVIIDYAHTPDALEKLLESVRAVCRGRVICVFGCGGDRDTGKRPQMGAIGERLADLAVVTSDNPRTEDPDAIIADILEGLKDKDACLVLADRRTAIAEAIGRAQEDDMVVIAGKGHEDYQIIGKEKKHFDDREEALKLLQG